MTRSKPKLPPNMMERNGRYFSRLIVPPALRPFHNGSPDLRAPLGGDLQAAKQKHRVAIGNLQALIGEAERKRALATGTAPRHDRYPLTAEQMARRTYAEGLALDMMARQQTHVYASMEIDAEHARQFKAGYSGQLSDLELQDLVGPMIDRYQAAGNHSAPFGSADWRKIAMAQCFARWEVYIREDERNEGNFEGQPAEGSILAEVKDAALGEPVTFDQIIDAEQKRRARGRDAKPLPDRTVKKYRDHAKAFAKWRSSDDARTVTADEGQRWIEAMQDAGENGNRTVAAKAKNVRTVLEWGRASDRKDFHPLANPFTGLRFPDFRTDPSHLRAFTLPEAKRVLQAARQEAKAMFRWIPFLCAYSGMRVSEAGKLRKEDFRQVDGNWFWSVTTAGRRTLKTESSERRIPVHSALVVEGLIEFVEKAKPGRLFVGSTKDEIEVQPRVGSWVRDIITLKEHPELSPNHGWRHLFEDLCRRDRVSEDARNYMTGRANGKSSQMYGRSDVMLSGLAAEMEQIIPFNI